MSYSLAIVCDKCKVYRWNFAMVGTKTTLGVASNDFDGAKKSLVFLEEHNGCQKEGLRIIISDPFVDDLLKYTEVE